MKKKGFTLIELLVVIAIIGLLSSIVLANINVARLKARDAKRLEDIRSVQTALELYYGANGSYPMMIAYATPRGESLWTSAFAAALQPYLPSVPLDYPINGFLYSSTNGGQKYGLATGLDSSGHTSLMANDGGYYAAYYELGPAPSECASAGKDWWGSTAINCP